MKDTTYFRRNYSAKSKFKYIMILNDFIAEYTGTRKEAKKLAKKLRAQYGI